MSYRESARDKRHWEMRQGFQKGPQGDDLLCDLTGTTYSLCFCIHQPANLAVL